LTGIVLEIGPVRNKEYLSQIQFYSIFSELPVVRNTVVIITVCVKVAKSTFFVTNKKTKWAELSRYYLCMLFEGNFRLLKTNCNMMHQMLH